MLWTPDTSITDKLSYTSFSALGGRHVGLDELRDELARLPLDMVLGIISRLSASYLKEGNRFLDPRYQGQYLASAIADDFPECLAGAARMYVPGRVPITGNRHLFMHEHNLCALTKLALRHSAVGTVTARLSGPDYGRICRILLILNDHLTLQRSLNEPTTSLRTRRQFAIETLYCGQFDHYTGDFRSALIAIARTRLLLVQYLPHRSDFDERFRARAGMDLETYFDLATFLVCHAIAVPAQVSREQSPWASRPEFAKQIPQHRDALERLVSELTQSVDTTGSARGDEVRPELELFEFHSLQQKPFVEGRPGELIVPVFSLLLRQLISFPIVLLRDEQAFMEALGEAYERYAHSLAVRIANCNRVRLIPRPGEKLPSGEIDSLLYGGGSAVVMEHKAKQVVSLLGSVSVARNAIGPLDDELDSLGADRRPKDKSAVTQPIWQLRALAPEFEEHSVRSWNHRPEEVFPIVTLLEAYRIDEWVRRGYLEPLIDASGTRLPDSWRAIEWLHASDLEALAALAERGELDLAALLRDKSLKPWSRFDIFLAERHEGSVPLDNDLWREAEAMVERSSIRIFGAAPRAEGDSST